ncbi:1-deoxy-D-xylulose-5-phosphate reductoisomerase [Camelliibacillus cellulosilyticus]|uniref:1-deoxy-D-xylulose 5-phosphate reductoisomerase n=1 Tax=Camelliibacillus cellulosilyticus TaxID=2174486 RepID=A0ABV9GJG3_9BACL
MKTISLLGATGSVGTQTVQVVLSHPEDFQIGALAFGQNIHEGAKIIEQVRPKLVAVQDKDVAHRLQALLSFPVKIVTGMNGLIEVASYPEADIVVNALLGSLGLQPTLTAIESGKPIAFANKETLVTAGHLVMRKAKDRNVPLLPIDSEHSAIFQALKNEKKSQVHRLIITASGGSFRDLSREELADVTVQDALKHPNWMMGAKLTVDSATMMNKGLEVIEAHWLFDMPYDRIDVLIHKESIVHSLVEYNDKSVIAQLGPADLRVPIQYALSYPDRLECQGPKRLNLWEMGALHFQKMDFERFPCLRWAYEAGKIGGSILTVLNAANEAAVQAFLNEKIKFLDIEKLVYDAMAHHASIQEPDLETIIAVDKETRDAVSKKAKDV